MLRPRRMSHSNRFSSSKRRRLTNKIVESQSQIQSRMTSIFVITMINSLLRNTGRPYMDLMARWPRALTWPGAPLSVYFVYTWHVFIILIQIFDTIFKFLKLFQTFLVFVYFFTRQIYDCSTGFLVYVCWIVGSNIIIIMSRRSYILWRWWRAVVGIKSGYTHGQHQH